MQVSSQRCPFQSRQHHLTLFLFATGPMRQFRRILLGVLAGIALTAYVILSFPIRLSDSRPALWADIPVETAEEFWEWLADENKRLRGVTRRASWGALSGQGAKASIRTNLRDDRRYLMSRNSGG
jgi:hypothetical protein